MSLYSEPFKMPKIENNLPLSNTITVYCAPYKTYEPEKPAA